MTKIILVTYTEKGVIRVSHGINAETLQNVVLPPEPLQKFKPVLDPLLNEWVIYE